MPALEINSLIAAAGARLTAAERRVAQAVLERPQLIAFGTVADLAAAADAGTATVVRLAAKLGFEGFAEMQDCVQRDLADQLRPAAERIRDLDLSQPLERHLATMVGNVQATLANIDPAALDSVASMVADLERPVLILAADAVSGVGAQFHRNLAALRSGVTLLTGSEVTVRRQLAERAATSARPGVLVVVDFRRYERWILDVVAQARADGYSVVTCTDGPLSPLSMVADVSFTLAAESLSPFESHLGTLAVFEVLVAFVAERLRPTAVERLARVDDAWAEGDALTDH